MKKTLFTVFILLLCFTIVSAQQNANSTNIIFKENYNKIAEDKTLLVLKYEVNPEAAKKLKAEKKLDLLNYYTALVELKNKTLWKAVEQGWTLNSTIEFKTLDEIDALAKGANPDAFLVLAQYTLLNIGTEQNPYYYADFEGDVWGESLVESLNSMPSYSPLNWDDSLTYYYKPLELSNTYISLFALDELDVKAKKKTDYEYKVTPLIKFSLSFKITPERYMSPMIKLINDYISAGKNDHDKTKEAFFTENHTDLKDLVLALPNTFFANTATIPKRWKDEICTEEQFKKEYPYEYKIFSEEEYTKLVDSKAKGYAVINFASIRGNSDLFISNLNTSDVILVTRPPYKTGNDIRLTSLKSNQFSYLINTIKGLESE